MGTTSLTNLLGIKYPIIQGGMVWVSGANLASAVSEAGGLGLIGAGSMKPDLLKEQITKAKSKTNKPLGVNVPLLYDKAEEQINVALDCGIKIFFTSAGSPKKWTAYLHSKGAIVFHVTSSPELALKCAEAGVDGVVVEGFEAGGHNGREEITSMVLIPQVKKLFLEKNINIPIIAAGGIHHGGGLLAAMALGADGVQMGTRFLMTKESSAHDNFKNTLLNAKPGSTKLMMKATVPVRLYENQFAKEIQTIEENFHGEELKAKLHEHLGKGRAKNGMLLGDIENGELEVGQIISAIHNIPTVKEVIDDIMSDFDQRLQLLTRVKF